MEMITNFVDSHNTHVTITDDDGIEYEYSIGLHRTNATVEECLFDVKQQMYRAKPIEIKTLEDMEQWIADGHIIQIQTGVDEAGDPVYEDQVIEKVPWTGTHPKQIQYLDTLAISQEIKQAFQAADTVGALKAILADIFQLSQ